MIANVVCCHQLSENTGQCEVTEKHSRRTLSLDEGKTVPGGRAVVWCCIKVPLEEADMVKAQPGGRSSEGEAQVCLGGIRAAFNKSNSAVHFMSEVKLRSMLSV